MSDELEIIKKQLPEMAGILNAVPGERFELKCAQTLLIVQRRMEESELQTQLAISCAGNEGFKHYSFVKGQCPCCGRLSERDY